jgi:hypothetical protein
LTSVFRRFLISRFGSRLAQRRCNNRPVAEYPDATEGKTALGAEVSRMLKQLTDEQATMLRLAA